jgi:tRNA modification GTPase
VLSTDLDIDGFLVKLYDTAGLRETDEVVEREGIRRARTAMDDADRLALVRHERGLGASARGRGSSFASSVSATNDDDIEP